LRRRGLPRSRIRYSIGTMHEWRRKDKQPSPSLVAELLHFLGEVEVVFGLWAVVLVAGMTTY
jgi:hypothetical protein